MPTEINAHSLLALIIILRDIPLDDKYFSPWLFGSQSCEKTFRSLRSMTGVFSTIINFSMLGFLHRIHKLSIKDKIQSETEKIKHGMSFPRQEKHKHKDGIGSHKEISSELSDEDIWNALSRAEARAKELMEELGMADDLQKGNMWDIPPIPFNSQDIKLDEDDDDDDNEDGRNNEKEGENYVAMEEDPFVSSADSISNNYTERNQGIA